MAIELINGHAGEAHVSGADVGRLYAGLAGDGPYWLGSEPDVAMSDANTLTVGPCDLLADGMHMTLDGTDAWKIASGSSGKKRIDLACLLYSMDADTGVESVEPAVLQGEATSGTPEAPEVPSGARSSGSSAAYVQVAKVTLDGLTPTAEAVPELLPTLEETADNAGYVKLLGPETLYTNGGGVVSSASLSEDVAGWQLVATEWGDDMGRRWTQLHWLPSGKTVNVFCVDTDWNGKTGPTHMYVKWNAWKFSGKSFSRSMSFVWGTDGQRKINDAILYLYRVIGLVRAQG